MQNVSLLDLNDSYILCVCEGAAETAIMELLLENDRLIFTRENLVDKKPVNIRPAKRIEEIYLRQDYTKPVNIIRILDSTREIFKLGSLYKDRFRVYNVHTTPEIEMLIIINEGCYDKYKNKNKSRKEKPSQYCKRCFGMKGVKSTLFIREYFSDIEALVYAIHEYNRLSTHDVLNLSDLLK